MNEENVDGLIDNEESENQEETPINEHETDPLEDYRALLKNYEEEGWDTRILEKALQSDDEEEIIWAFEEFPKAIEHLKMLRKRVEELKDFFPPNTAYRGATYEEIMERANNPEAIPWIELEIENREKKIEEAKEALERTIERWSAYDTSSLEREFRSVPEIYDAIREFESGIEMQDNLREEVEYLAAKGMLTAEELRELNGMLLNPTSASEVEKILNSIYMREKKRGKEEILKQIDTWEKEGFDVSPLKGMLNEDITVLRKEMDRFGNGIKRLQELEKRLNVLDPSVRDEIESLREMLKNVDKIRETEMRINDIEQKIWKKKEALLRRARELKQKGVDIGDFEIRAMGYTLSEMEEKLKEFEERSRKIKPTTTGMTPSLKSPPSRVGEFIQRRERIFHRMKEWEERGYDVSGLEEVKDQDINTLEEVFNRFREGVEKLEEIRKGIEELPEELRKEAEKVIGELNDPLNYFDAEKNYLYLHEKADYMRRMSELSGILKKARDTLTEVKSLEFELEMEPGVKLEKEDELSNYREQLKVWKEKGYNTARLELALRTGVLDLVKRMFNSFDKDVERLREIEKTLNSLDTTGFRKRERMIRENLKNPEEVITTLKHLIELEMDIRRRMKMDV